MHRKSFTLAAPLDTFAVPLELLMSSIAKDGLVSAKGEYIGDGTSSLKVQTSIPPMVVMIAPKIVLSTSAVLQSGLVSFSFIHNAGATWVPASGKYGEYSCFIKNGVLTFVNDGFTVGNHAAVNTANQTYLYFVVG